jgi:branched-chain amino acid transport system permease protein
VTTIFAGLATGSVYVLVAISYNLVFLSTGIFNFAQAQFLMVGTLIAYTAIINLRIPVLLAIVLALVLGALLGGIEEVLAIRPLEGRGVHGELVTTLGVAVLLEGVAVLLWGSQPLAVPFFGSERVLTLLSGRVLPVELTLVAIACAVTLGAELLSRRTTLGLTSLATAEDRIAAMLRGVNVRALSLGSFAASGALCMALGPFAAPKTFASFEIGDSLAIKGFVAAAIGGFGSHKGAFIGGIATGVLEAAVGRYLGVSYENIATYALLLLVLLIRPIGLFGERQRRAV